jgi:S1-C subfamily serine protease
LKRKVLYSRAARKRSSSERFDFNGAALDWDVQQGPGPFAGLWRKVGGFYARHDRLVPAALAVLVSLAVITAWRLAHPLPAALTQYDIDSAVKYTLAHTPEGPAPTTLAAAMVMPSVVRVDGYLSPEHQAELAKEEAEAERKAGHGKDAAPLKTPAPLSPEKDDGSADHPDSTGSGVVIDEGGSILTNLHVIRSTDRWVVTFADGSKSEANLVSMQPENDLAVIKAKTAPDDLKPATLASTRDLNPGDTVVAVGFPFGIGPSVSSGVVAGLKREFIDPDRKPEDGGKLTNLIQFDAAVNPGNSGGPLVNRDGEVVGIVTALYNPSGAHVFAGIGFAVPIENAARAVGQNPL